MHHSVHVHVDRSFCLSVRLSAFVSATVCLTVRVCPVCRSVCLCGVPKRLTSSCIGDGHLDHTRKQIHRNRGGSNPCRHSPMGCGSISLTARTQSVAREHDTYLMNSKMCLEPLLARHTRQTLIEQAKNKPMSERGLMSCLAALPC